MFQGNLPEKDQNKNFQNIQSQVELKIFLNFSRKDKWFFLLKIEKISLEILIDWSIEKRGVLWTFSFLKANPELREFRKENQKKQVDNS